MEVQSYGANTIRINTKKTTIIVDDSADMHGGKSYVKDGDIVIYTTRNDIKSDKKERLLINSAGEYEVADVLIIGVPAFPYKDDEKLNKLTNTVYKLVSDDTSLAIMGNASSELSDSQLEALGEVDALIIPVGGNSYTLDASQALKVIKKIDPFIVIPTHYDDGVTKHKVIQDKIEDVVKALGLEIIETTNKLKLKGSSFSEGQNTGLVILETNS
ncbi:MAG TPA: MBL fold metallo-hydrolase [Candidatus Saccharimonadia bacterium]|nr:MBL fold metallo-hydrolase [Candidatus Saccharimonadia bacterium]